MKRRTSADSVAGGGKATGGLLTKLIGLVVTAAALCGLALALSAGAERADQRAQKPTPTPSFERKAPRRGGPDTPRPAAPAAPAPARGDRDDVGKRPSFGGGDPSRSQTDRALGIPTSAQTRASHRLLDRAVALVKARDRRGRVGTEAELAAWLSRALGTPVLADVDRPAPGQVALRLNSGVCIITTTAGDIRHPSVSTLYVD